jgi:hypothetical protein
MCADIAIEDDMRPPGRLPDGLRNRIILDSKLNVVNRFTVNTL